METPATIAVQVGAPHHAGARVVRQRQIQALRAFAVASVVVYHLWPTRLTGGYVGVDVFFVISGYLMTSTILRLRGRGASFLELTREFYSRRARRILPAAVVTLLVTCLVVTTLTPIDWQTNFREIFASSLFFENWSLLQQSTDYLAAARGASAVQHFWSLSVEEQFYALWPTTLFAVIGTAGRTRRRTLRLAAGLTLVFGLSLAWCVHETTSDPSRAYFDTGARIWEFTVGAGVYLVHESGRFRHPHAKALAGWSGLLLLVASVVSFSADTSFPGWHASVPVAAAALIILCGDDSARWGPSGLLATRPLQWLGDVSYSVYLVHWPLLVLSADLLAGGATTTGRQRLLLAPVILALAVVLKRLVEDPMRRPRVGIAGRPGLVVRAGALILLGTVAVSAVALVGSQRVADRANLARARLTSFSAAVATCFGPKLTAPAHACRPSGDARNDVVPDPLIATLDYPFAPCQQSSTSSTILTCRYGSGGRVVAVVGDSHVTQWIPALLPWATHRGYRLVTYLKSGCTMTAASRIPSCAQWNDAVWEALRSEPPAVVITSGESPKNRPTSSQVEGMATAWTRVEHAGSVVVPIRDIPQPRAAGIENVPKCLMTSTPGGCTFDRDTAIRHDLVSLVATRLSDHPLVDLTDAFCTGARCPPTQDRALVYLDGTHMTATFARSLTTTLSPALDAALR